MTNQMNPNLAAFLNMLPRDRTDRDKRTRALYGAPVLLSKPDLAVFYRTAYNFSPDFDRSQLYLLRRIGHMLGHPVPPASLSGHSPALGQYGEEAAGAPYGSAGYTPTGYGDPGPGGGGSVNWANILRGVGAVAGGIVGAATGTGAPGAGYTPGGQYPGGYMPGYSPTGYPPYGMYPPTQGASGGYSPYGSTPYNPNPYGYPSPYGYQPTAAPGVPSTTPTAPKPVTSSDSTPLWIGLGLLALLLVTGGGRRMNPFKSKRRRRRRRR